MLMVDSLAAGVARGWRGFRRGGGCRGGKRGPSTRRRRAPSEVGREKRARRKKRAEGSRLWRGGGEATGPAADPGPPKSKFTIVCSPRLRYSFSAYPFFEGPFLSSSSRLLPPSRFISLVRVPFTRSRIVSSSLSLSLSLSLCFFFIFFLPFLPFLLFSLVSFFVSRVGSPTNRADGTSERDKRRAPEPRGQRGKSREVRHARFG